MWGHLPKQVQVPLPISDLPLRKTDLIFKICACLNLSSGILSQPNQKYSPRGSRSGTQWEIRERILTAIRISHSSLDMTTQRLQDGYIYLLLADSRQELQHQQQVVLPATQLGQFYIRDRGRETSIYFGIKVQETELFSALEITCQEHHGVFLGQVSISVADLCFSHPLAVWLQIGAIWNRCDKTPWRFNPRQQALQDPGK